MSSVAASGTLSGQPIGTETVVADVPAGFTYVCVVDLSNLAVGDDVTLAVYDIAIASAPRKVAYEATFADVQTPDPLKYSLPIPSTHGARLTITQTAGVARSIPWEVRQL